MGTKIFVAAFTSLVLSVFFAVLLLIAIITQSQTEKNKSGGCKENQCFSASIIIAFIVAMIVILASGCLIKRNLSRSKFIRLDESLVKFEEMNVAEPDTEDTDIGEKNE